MKKNLLYIAVAFASVVSYAQQGNVGVNTVNPKATLDIAKKTANNTTDVEGILIPRVSKNKAFLMGGNTSIEASTMIYVDDLSDYTTTPVSATVAEITEQGYYFWNGNLWTKLTDTNDSQAISKWTNDATNDVVKLTNLSDGTTARTADKNIFINDDGRIGIGTHDFNSSVVLEIEKHGDIRVRNGGLLLNRNQNEGGVIAIDNGLKNGLSGAVSRWAIYNMTGSYSKGLHFWGYNWNSSTNSFDNLGTKVFFGDNGNVGIGTSEPSAKLHVNGNTRIGSLPAGTTTDQLVTTDASGNLRKLSRTVASVNLFNNNGMLTANRTVTMASHSLAFNGGTVSTDRDMIVNSIIVGRGSGSSPTYNLAVGENTLQANTTGFNNTAIGGSVLSSNTTGVRNTAIGAGALSRNISGYDNTAIGLLALSSNTTGYTNTANGAWALSKNVSGNSNTATGEYALHRNTTGRSNTASGRGTLSNNTTGSYNVAMGASALSNSTTGNNNIGIGFNVEVPNPTASNQVRIGNTAITYAGIQVSWTTTSDKRWKKDIRSLPYGLSFVNKLRPVDYVRKNDEANTKEIGFIAQEVEQTLQDLGYKNTGILAKDDKGYMSLRYNDFIPVLTKAIQEQQKQIEILKAKADKVYELEKLVKKLLNK